MQQIDLEKQPLRILKLLRKKYRGQEKTPLNKSLLFALTATIERKQAEHAAAVKPSGVNRKMRRKHFATQGDKK